MSLGQSFRTVVHTEFVNTIINNSHTGQETQWTKKWTMSRWYLLSNGSYHWSVPKSLCTSPSARTDTDRTLQRLEPAPIGLKTDHCNVLLDNHKPWRSWEKTPFQVTIRDVGGWCLFIFNHIKKDEDQGKGSVTFKLWWSQNVSVGQNTEEKVRGKEVKARRVGRRERRKHGRGLKDRDERC